MITGVDQPTDWCAPMVNVPKSDDAVRIGVNITKLNESVRRKRHEMPPIEYTLGQLAGARIFSKLDANTWACERNSDYLLGKRGDGPQATGVTSRAEDTGRPTRHDSTVPLQHLIGLHTGKIPGGGGHFVSNTHSKH